MSESVNTPAIFENAEFGKVRAFMRNGEPWFVANDVAAALGYVDHKQAVRDHCKYAELLKGVDSTPLTESPRGINVIPESDVYALIFRSNLPKAEEFRRWVCEEVLPSIRKTGQYATATARSNIMDVVRLQALRNFYREDCGAKGTQATRAIDRAWKRIEGFSPLEYGEIRLANAPDDDLINYTTVTEIGKLFGISAVKLNPILTELGLQTREQKWKTAKLEDGTEAEIPAGFDYMPTTLGELHGGKRVSDSAANNVQKEVWSLKWHKDKLPAYLRETYFKDEDDNS